MTSEAIHIQTSKSLQPTPQFETCVRNTQPSSCTFLRGLWVWVYTNFAPIATRVGYKKHAARLCGVAAILLVHQAHSCFGAQVFSQSEYSIRILCLQSAYCGD
ncbi:hypothetical protein EDD22DRAFT_889163 [Suillus occidentalis]|nr:hypothetical protein EDD22DRAFT_889163 [Suillus occidentalis]